MAISLTKHYLQTIRHTQKEDITISWPSVLPNATYKQSGIHRRRTSQSAGHQSCQTLPANNQAYIEEGHHNQLAISLTKHYL
ncbi:hypothetical protein DPMN_052085 [Dreissena polymorpha]|uniref:Uncharacterized protein n=1 Tax=Dreissena polymorpha TaxID=45954 RepID=A0A9D4CJT0_DREPO|nr:hypothetical protein DPMN_052085 [Dreissena polymorpha]